MCVEPLGSLLRTGRVGLDALPTGRGLDYVHGAWRRSPRTCGQGKSGLWTPSSIAKRNLCFAPSSFTDALKAYG